MLESEKLPDVGEHLEKGPIDDEAEVAPLQYDPAFVKRTMRKVSDTCRILADACKLDLLVMPAIVIVYLFCSLDRSNLANAKTLGMVVDIGGDPTGNNYALINAMYYIGYAPFSESSHEDR